MLIFNLIHILFHLLIATSLKKNTGGKNSSSSNINNNGWVELGESGLGRKGEMGTKEMWRPGEGVGYKYVITSGRKDYKGLN